MNKTIQFSTNQKFEIVDLTDQVEEIVDQAKVDNGFCLVFAPHATAAVILNENESGLKDDLILQIKTMFDSKIGFRHDQIDDNAQAHLSASFLGQEVTLPIVGGQLIRGTWQSILFVELDGPRQARRVVVSLK